MRALALAVCATSLLACAPKPKAAAPAASSGDEKQAKPKFDFQGLVKREAGMLRPWSVSAPDGSWSASISAVSAPKLKESENDSISLDVDVGSERHLDCVVWKQRLDVAMTLKKLAVEPLEKLPLKEIARVDVGVEEGFPNATLDMFALNEKKEASHIKSTLVVRPQWTVGCRHDELGYAETVRAAALELGRTLKPAVPERGSRLHEIAIGRVGETPVGFIERFLLDGKDGGTLELEYDASVLPLANNTLVFGDAVRVVEMDGAGLIRTVTAVDAGTSGIERSLKLVRKRDREYAVDGTDKSGAVHGTFKTKQPLEGSRRLSEKIAAHARGGARSPLAFEMWRPSRGPLQATLETYTPSPGFDPAAPTYTVESAGGEKATITFDRRGLQARMSMTVGTQVLAVSRVFSRGTP